MTLIEFIKDLIDSGKERIKTPITSTFFIIFSIHNWRPILLLFFSDKSIEQKIETITNDYCSYSAFLLPLAYTCVFLVIIPFLSAGLEKLLYLPSSVRRSTKNKEKIDTVENKIILADAELKLQDKLSRNQEIVQLREKIEELEAKIQTDAQAHAALSKDTDKIVRELTEKLNAANNTKPVRSGALLEEVNTYAKMMSDNPLSNQEIDELLKLPISATKNLPRNLSLNTYKFLHDNEMTVARRTFYYLTEKGMDFLTFLSIKHVLTSKIEL